LLPLAAVLGAGVVILPAVASSEATPTIEAVHEGGVYGGYRWKPPIATVNAGGGVTFSNPSTTVYHGVEWVSRPAEPVCSGVPVGKGPAASAKNWTGNCTFTQPGTYTFYCTVHGPEMAGTITVNANGTTTMTTTTSTQPTGTTPTSTNGTTQSGPSQPPPGAGAPGSPLAGSAASAVKLAAIQRGGSVRGSVDVSAAGAGGRLTIELLAKSASLASAGHGARVRVGHLVLSNLHSGKMAFAVPLSSRARGALRRHHRLPVTARLQIQGHSGSALTIMRSVTLHP
jgi:plastocyanin